MKRQLVGFDLSFFTGIINETFSENSLFTVRDHPADYIPDENIQDDIEVKLGPFSRAFQLGSIP